MAEEAEAKAKISETQRAIYDAIALGELPPLQGAEQLARIYLALGSASGSGGGDASDATLREILAAVATETTLASALSKLPDYNTPRTSSGFTHVDTSGIVPAGARVVYFACISGTATLFGGGILLDSTGSSSVPDFNFEYPGPGGHGEIPWSVPNGTLLIVETR